MGSNNISVALRDVVRDVLVQVNKSNESSGLYVLYGKTRIYYHPFKYELNHYILFHSETCHSKSNNFLSIKPVVLY